MTNFNKATGNATSATNASTYWNRQRRTVSRASAAILLAACAIFLLSLPSPSSSEDGMGGGARNLDASSDISKSGGRGSGEMILRHGSMGGRMGNQLWEYAATIGLARKHGMKACIPEGMFTEFLDMSFKGPFFRDCKDVRRSGAWGEAFAHGYKDFGKPPPEASAIELNGYLQSMKYFENYTDEVVQAFELKDEHREKAERFLQKWSVGKDGKPVVKVGVHVRAFSKTGTPWANSPPLEYYKQAMDAMRKKHGQGRVIFIVAAEWHRVANFKKSAVFVSPDVVILGDAWGTGIEDMAVLMNCDHMIMSVGTFGWWSAWLGAYQRGGDVIYWGNPYHLEHPHWGGNKFDMSETFPLEWRAIGESDLVAGSISHSESKS